MRKVKLRTLSGNSFDKFEFSSLFYLETFEKNGSNMRKK